MLDDRRSSLAEFFSIFTTFYTVCKSSVLEAVEVWDAPGIFSVFFCIPALFTPSYYHDQRRKICWNFRSCRVWKILAGLCTYWCFLSMYTRIVFFRKLAKNVFSIITFSAELAIWTELSPGKFWSALKTNLTPG